MREGNQEECPYLRHCKSNKVMLLRLSVDKKKPFKNRIFPSPLHSHLRIRTLENTSWLWGERRKPPIWIKKQHITTHHLSSRLGLRGEKRARKKLCLAFFPAEMRIFFRLRIRFCRKITKRQCGPIVNKGCINISLEYACSEFGKRGKFQFCKKKRRVNKRAKRKSSFGKMWTGTRPRFSELECSSKQTYWLDRWENKIMTHLTWRVE